MIMEVINIENAKGAAGARTDGSEPPVSYSMPKQDAAEIRRATNGGRLFETASELDPATARESYKDAIAQLDAHTVDKLRQVSVALNTKGFNFKALESQDSFHPALQFKELFEPDFTGLSEEEKAQKIESIKEATQASREAVNNIIKKKEALGSKPDVGVVLAENIEKYLKYVADQKFIKPDNTIDESALTAHKETYHELLTLLGSKELNDYQLMIKIMIGKNLNKIAVSNEFPNDTAGLDTEMLKQIYDYHQAQRGSKVSSAVSAAQRGQTGSVAATGEEVFVEPGSVGFERRDPSLSYDLEIALEKRVGSDKTYVTYRRKEDSKNHVSVYINSNLTTAQSGWYDADAYIKEFGDQPINFKTEQEQNFMLNYVLPTSEYEVKSVGGRSPASRRRISKPAPGAYRGKGTSGMLVPDPATPFLEENEVGWAFQDNKLKQGLGEGVSGSDLIYVWKMKDPTKGATAGNLQLIGRPPKTGEVDYALAQQVKVASTSLRLEELNAEQQVLIERAETEMSAQEQKRKVLVAKTDSRVAKEARKTAEEKAKEGRVPWEDVEEKTKIAKKTTKNVGGTVEEMTDVLRNIRELIGVFNGDK